MDILKETSFDFLGRKIAGKVRDIYDQGDTLVLVTTDRHSSFDRIIAHVPWKGQVLNQVSAHWFEQTKDIVPNHVLAIPDPNVTVAKKCAMVLIDEIHTPDSSRYWQRESYATRFAAGEEPHYFDKEFLRLWFKDHSDPYADATLPEAPVDLVAELSRRYIQMYEQITGRKFEYGVTPVLPRIERNLKSYRI